jgi:uncharacterized protein (DUF1684 family)
MLVFVGGISVGSCAPRERRQAGTEITAAETPAEEVPVDEADLDEEAWTAALLEHRAEIDQEFRTSSDSPMAGAQYLKSEPAERVFLTRQDRTFKLAYSTEPGAELELVQGGETWHWKRLGQEIVCRVEGEEVAEGSALEGLAYFDVGGFHLSFYPSEDRVTFIVFDPERAEMKEFQHLLYYQPDKNYAVAAKLDVISEPEEIEMLTSRDLKKTFYRYATIAFELDGEDYELAAYKSELEGEGSKGLFIPFKDATTGSETYGAGRFLEIDDPDGEQFVLDFNRSFNPLCNYSPAYNCAVPPRENHLQVAIRAGELTYPH